MFVLQADEFRSADQWTLSAQGLTAWQLMERAATCLLAAIAQDYLLHRHTFAVLCGPGNNGGDGLAIARLIQNKGGKCTAYLLESSQYSPENYENQSQLTSLQPFNAESSLSLPDNLIVIDALYGNGLKRPLHAGWATFIQKLGTRTVLSIDLPSGMQADGPSDGPVFPSTKVYTIHAPKLAFFAPENEVQDFTTVDIGLQVKSPSIYHYTGPDEAKQILKWPSRFSHKGSFGHAYLIGGSAGMTGALCLAARASLRGGCGLVSVYGPNLALDLPPEVMVHHDPHIFLSEPPVLPDKASAVGIGMGLGKNAATFMKHFLSQPPAIPLVLDADALNHIANLKLTVPRGSILTPHLKEFERLCGSSINSFERWEKAEKFAVSTQTVLVLKGANTCIFLPDGQRHYNASGNYGMAKGGSGDCLTGLITALRAQGYASDEAAILGVYLHGLAGDLAAESMGPDALCASDLISYLPGAWKLLRASNTTEQGKLQ